MTDTAPKPDPGPSGYSQADWDEVSDNPELSEAELAELRPAREVPEIHDLLPKPGRGRPKRMDAKINVTLRLEPALLEAYKATGAGWQVRMQEALASFLAADLGSSAGSDRFNRTGRKRANLARLKST